MRDTELMKVYEEQTGNLAVIDGEVTTEFRKWRKKRIREKEKQERKKELIKVEKQRELKEEFEEGKKAGKDYDHLIVVENIHKTYILGTTAIAALRGVDVKINKGEFVSIMGPSGSGKTTLLNLIGGLDTPTRGKIFLEGRNISMLKDKELADIRRDKIGFVFQFYNLLPQMTALENVMVPLHFSGKLSKRGKKKRCMDLLRMVGLEERADHTPSELSGGEQQRVAIARAFANDPAICVLDEPTGDLDSKTGIHILNLLRDLNQRGATFIAVSHDAAVSEFATRTLHMKDGKLIREGKVGGLKETEVMEMRRKKDAQINKEKVKNKIYQYLFKNQGRKEFEIGEIQNHIPDLILKNLPIHFNDIIQEIIEDNSIQAKIEGNILILK